MTFATKKIVIIEDENIVAKNLQLLLVRMNYVVPAVSAYGEDLLQLTEQHVPDVVLIDVGLRGKIDGIEAARRLHEVKDIPVIFITANSDVATLERAKIAQPYGFILKPFDDREIQSMIEMAISRHQADREIAESRTWLATTLQSIGDAVIATDEHGAVKFMNPNAEHLTGWQQKEAIGLPLPEVFHIINEATGERADNPVDIVLKEKRTVELSAYTVLRAKDGTEYIIDDSAAPILSHTGEVSGVVLTFRDITEKHKIRAEQKASERRFRALIENSDDIISLHDKDGKILYATPAISRILGYGVEENMNKSTFDLIHPDDHATTLHKLGELIAKPNIPIPVRHRLRHKDGSWHWIEGTVTNLLNDPAVGTIVSNFRDITDRTNAEDKLRESEEKFREVVQNASDIITLVDKNGTILYESPSVFPTLGYQQGELVGQNIFELLHPDDRNVAQNEFRKSIGQVGNDAKMELRFRAKNNEYVYLESKGNNQLDNPAIMAVVVTSRDITERKSTEKILRIYERALQNTSEGIAISDAMQPANPIIFANDGFCAMTGYSREEILGQNCRFLQGKDTDKATVAAMSKSIIEKTSFEGEILNYKKDGTPFWNFLRITPIPDEAGTITHFVGLQSDSTERKKIENSLRESEHKYRSVVAVMQEGIVLHNEKAEIIDANESAQKILGMELHELLGRTPLDPRWNAIDEDGNEFPRSAHPAMRTLETGMPVTEAVMGIRKPGSKHLTWVSMNSEPLFNQGKSTPDGVVVSFSDITVRKEAEVSLKISEARLSGVIESAMDAVITIDTNYNIVLFNKAAEEMFMYPAADVIGHSLDRLIPARFRASHARYVKKFGDDGHTSRSMGHLLVLSGLRANGEEFPIETSISQIDTIIGKLFTVILRDVTERRNTEQRIREQAALLDIVPDAIIVRDLNHIIVSWSKGAERMYGWTAEETIGKSAPKLLGASEGSDFYRTQEILLEKNEWSGEFIQTTKDNRKILVESRWKLVRNAENIPTAVLVTNTDITEKKSLEKQLFRAQRLESIGTLASGIAHDLNNILTPVVLGMEIIKMKLTDEQSVKRIDTIISTVQRGSGLIGQVLSFARGSQEELQPVNVKYTIDEVIKMARLTFPKEIDVQVNMPTEDLIVHGNPTQLHQVIMNLCINSRDAMKERGGILSVEAGYIIANEYILQHFIDARPGTYVQITIRDTGKGIPHELQDKVFEPFFTTKEVGKGTGIGLTTVFSIVRNHGGFLHLYSEVNVGTSFSIYLPAEISQEHSLEEPPKEELAVANNETVLLVEDEELIRSIAEDILQSSGYRVITAVNGAEAAQIYREQSSEIDIVVTDVMMPVVGGLELIGLLKAINPDVRVIAASGLMHGEIAKNLSNAGAMALLSKPYTADKLLGTLREVLSP